MHEEKNHITFTAEDIRRYHEGTLTPAQMHELEKASLEDPFLADALEGYAVEDVQVPADISELRKRLEERVADKTVVPLAAPSKAFSWLRIAAMIIAVAGAGLLVYNLGFNKKENTIAQQTDHLIDQQPNTPKTDTISSDFKARDTGTQDETVKNNSSPAAEQHPEGRTTEAVQGLISTGKGDLQKEKPPVEIAAEKPAAMPVDNIAASSGGKDKAANVPSAAKPAEIKERSNRADTEAKQSRDFFAQQEAKAESNYNTSLNNARQNNMQNLAKSRRTQNGSAINIFRGRVTDQQNNPLPFANITNNADNIGTYADGQGNFVLTSPDSIMDVQVRSLGFESNNIQLQNGLIVNKVSLKDDESVPALVLSNKKVNAKMRENNMVLEEPEPADGWTKYDAYLANNIKLPEDYKTKPQEGNEVTLSFEVNQLGEPINIKVERSLCEVCDKEAIRLLKEGPKWKRKARKGKRTTVTIPF